MKEMILYIFYYGHVELMNTFRKKWWENGINYKRTELLS